MINISTFITNIIITIVIVTTIAHHHSDQAAHLERLDLSYNNLRELDSATLASLKNLLVLKVTKI